MTFPLYDWSLAIILIIKLSYIDIEIRMYVCMYVYKYWFVINVSIDVNV